jgi:general secretion pathway protein D
MCLTKAIHLFALVLIAGVIASCTGDPLNGSGSDLLESKLESKTSRPGSKQARLNQFLAENSSRQNFKGVNQIGNDVQLGIGEQQTLLSSGTSERNIRLNLVDASVASAARSVLGDILEVNYSIDPKVQGTITVQTSKPLNKDEVVGLFESALANIGAAIVGDGESFRIIPQAEVSNTALPLQTGDGSSDVPGQGQYIVPIRYVSAEDVREVIDPLIPEGMLVKVSTGRNALLLVGTARQVAAIKETISVFDVDWMKGKSFALVPLKSSRPDSIVDDLNQIFETKKGPLRGLVRFVPNKRLRSVLVISSRAKYIGEAQRWIKKLDVLAETSEEQLFVYHVQNRTATELAKVLQSVLRSEGSLRVSTTTRGNTAPRAKRQIAETQSVGAENISGPETPATGLGSNLDESNQTGGLVDNALLQADEVLPQSELDKPNSIRVVADDSNNSLLIFATRAEYKRIIDVLQQVDEQPNQVLLEAVIAEVSLDDELKFGVRWLLGGEDNKATFSDLASGAVASSFPGFSYFLKANDIGFTLNALASVTDVRILSSPSLMVVDNKKATLQVGDQVPIVTQQARSVDAGGAPIVNSVELKDTGVILNVTPRVNDSGRVILDVEQEVSSVVRTTTSGIDSPTIRQRKIKTSVVINDGEALALGGLIQERETNGKNKVPLLGDIPILGNAFRQKTNAIARTELIIFIRARVIRDMDEARRVTREFRHELGVQAPRVRRGEPTLGGELVRIIK